jgi:hypothetical protein
MFSITISSTMPVASLRMRINDLYFYVQVVDHKGSAPAARALGLSNTKLR